MPELGDRIKKARLDYGMSQAELTRRVAKRIAVSKQTIYDIESNRTRNPGILYIEAIANVLRLSVDALLGREQKDSELLPTEQDLVPGPARWVRLTQASTGGV